MALTKIQQTKNYRLFIRNPENRPTDARKHRKLRESLQRYGFLRCFPVVVRREDDKLIVKDGQHRLMIAETLGIPVWWVEEEVDFDIATINSAAKVWSLRDFALKHAANGLTDYAEGLEFAALHKLPIGTAFALLAGLTGLTACHDEFIDGTYKVKDRAWADLVAGIYAPLVAMSPEIRNARFVEACMAVARVPGFEADRIISGAKRQRDKLVAYSTRDAYLEMLEEIYNFKRSNLVGLKALATMAMRDRNPRHIKGERKSAITKDAIAKARKSKDIEARA